MSQLEKNKLDLLSVIQNNKQQDKNDDVIIHKIGG